MAGSRARLVEEAPDWIFLLDSSGRFLYLNGHFDSLFPGLKREQQVGRRLQELIWPPDVELAEDLIASALLQEKHPGGEVRFCQANGNISQLRLHLKPMILSQSGVGLLGVAQEVEFGPRVGIFEDQSFPGARGKPEKMSEAQQEQENQLQQLVRELNQAEKQAVRLTKEAEQAKEKLEQEMDQTDLLLSTLGTALVQIGPDFRLRSARGPAREWFGLSDRHLGLPCAGALWQNETGPCSGCTPPAAGVEPSWEEFGSPSGKTFRRLRLFKAGNGSAEGGWLELIQPEPEIPAPAEGKPAELPRQDALALAGRVAGTVAHEFNNIFSAIQGFAVLAEEDRSYVSDFVQTVKEQSRRGENLNQALLHLVQGCSSSEPSSELKQILEELSLLIERELNKMNVRLRPLLADTPAIQANPGALRRLLFGLFFQLAETMPKSSELIIQTRFNAEAAEVLLGSSPSPFLPERLEEVIGRTLAEAPSLCGKGRGFELRAEDQTSGGPALVIRLALAPNPKTQEAVATEEQT
jgi:PAS domain S-box-containing protein